VRLAEANGVELAEFGVIAASSLGDIVKQGREVQKFLALEPAHEPGAQGIFVRHLGYGETPHVAHDDQDVLIHRVHVKQVVLHAAHDAAERRQVESEQSVLVQARSVCVRPDGSRRISRNSALLRGRGENAALT